MALAGFIVFITEFSQPAGSEAWRVFCRHGTIFIACWCKHGTILRATRNLSRCRIWFEVGCAEIAVQICHGARNLSWCRVYWLAYARIRVPGHDKLSRKQKNPQNRDKFINTTVRVRWS
jgi:hypothetical protein